MTLRLIREASTPASTTGALYITGGRWVCWTLEDVVRQRVGVPVGNWKVPGQTAIPFGTYDLQVTMSARFKVPLPLLLGVPGFSGIRIHAGNTAADTEGCILVGQQRGPDRVTSSRLALEELMALLGSTVHAISIEAA